MTGDTENNFFSFLFLNFHTMAIIGGLVRVSSNGKAASYHGYNTISRRGNKGLILKSPLGFNSILIYKLP